MPPRWTPCGPDREQQQFGFSATIRQSEKPEHCPAVRATVSHTPGKGSSPRIAAASTPRRSGVERAFHDRHDVRQIGDAAFGKLQGGGHVPLIFLASGARP
jgi:hypothetical protein